MVSGGRRFDTFCVWFIVLLTCVCVLAYRYANQDVRYSLDKFLEMHRNTAAYSVFYSTFIPTIVGRSLMKKLVEDVSVFEEISTISDEALALLALENGVDRWDDVFTKCKGDVRPFTRGQPIPEGLTSTVQTKYTVSSTNDADGDKEGNDKRWSKEGIIGFNQLRQKIIKDRGAHSDFMERWLTQQRLATASGPNATSNAESNMVDAEDDFAASSAKKHGPRLKQASQSNNVVAHQSDDDGSESSFDT
jgi:hypothetical protein